MSKKDATYILNEIRNYLDEFNNASDDYYSFIKLSKELKERIAYKLNNLTGGKL